MLIDLLESSKAIGLCPMGIMDLTDKRLPAAKSRTGAILGI